MLCVLCVVHSCVHAGSSGFRVYVCLLYWCRMCIRVRMTMMLMMIRAQVRRLARLFKQNAQASVKNLWVKVAHVAHTQTYTPHVVVTQVHAFSAVFVGSTQQTAQLCANDNKSELFTLMRRWSALHSCPPIHIEIMHIMLRHTHTYIYARNMIMTRLMVHKSSPAKGQSILHLTSS